MKVKIILSLFFTTVLFADISDENTCFDCHQLMDEDLEQNEKVFENILEDIHLQVGLSCTDCHGGNSKTDDEDEAMWDDPTFRGKISKIDQPEICGSCHSDPQYMRQFISSVKTDQVSQYWTSQHGKDLKKGIEKVAVCTDCHGLHGIIKANDPRSKVYPLNIPATCSSCHSDLEYMESFGIPTDQYYLYRSSIHGTSLLDEQHLSAPACNDCHGNHGALPPDVVHIGDICGSCHVNNNALFQKSHLNEIFLTRGIGQCEACHGNHGVKSPTDEYLNWEHGAVCVQCHQTGGLPKDLADYFYHSIDSLKGRIKLAQDLLHEAEQKGMEVSDLYFSVEESQKMLIQSRTNIHSFNKEFISKTAEAGFKSADQAIEGASAALFEFNDRRKWLFISSLIITILATTVYFKIRDLDRRDLRKIKTKGEEDD
ncbi:MAG: cytochrome c3 family protein [Candidatus Neomarinimicrobiota bacterium]